jgi:hypothetical protein
MRKFLGCGLKSKNLCCCIVMTHTAILSVNFTMNIYIKVGKRKTIDGKRNLVLKNDGIDQKHICMRTTNLDQELRAKKNAIVRRVRSDGHRLQRPFGLDSHYR